MLILTRNVTEAIKINNGEITIRILGIKGNQVRLGVDAPKSITIHREEVQERIDNGEPMKKESNGNR